jgi:hypothetical protein
VDINYKMLEGNFLHFIKSIKRNFLLISLLIVLIFTAPKFSQFLSVNFWFSLNAQRKVDRSINSLIIRLPEGRIAGTSRSLANFGFTNDLLNLDYWAVPYSMWPSDVSGAIIPTDIGSTKEWSLNNLSDHYLLIRALLEAKNYKKVDQENGYQLWLAGKDEGNIDRLLRVVPISILDSPLSLRRDDNNKNYREISAGSKNRLVAYGPYVSLIPGSTEILIDAKINNWSIGNVFHVDIILDGKVIFQTDITYEDISNQRLIKIPENIIKAAGKYELVLFLAPDYIGDPIRVYGLHVNTRNSYLRDAKTFYIRLNEKCEVELPHYMLSGRYQSLNFQKIEVLSSSSRGIQVFSDGIFELYNDGQRDKLRVRFVSEGACNQLSYIKILEMKSY